MLSLAAGGFAATAATEVVSGRESVAQADALDRANGAEKAWCRVPSRLSLCLKAKALTAEAEVAAQNVSAEYGLAIHNGGADAFRHCYWSGLMTDEFGWQTAKGFGDRHEYKDGQDPREETMDLYNNRQGRIWAQQVDNIGQRCLEGALQGELKGFVPHKWQYKSMLKKIGLVSISLVVALALIAVGALIVDRMQRSQDQEALAQTVESNSSLKSFKNQKVIEGQVACKPNGSGATDCPALLYKISKQECSELQNKFGADKKWCGHNTRLSSDGRSIELRFGQVYERSDGNLYLTVVMNERNLLSF